ncbi:DUF4367 domain-containing protein [Natrialbaceae archaeon GCM10025810]|uniref:DUF4367 domain-containing protein n=1 Tax=Halovalidus salilacus TaxID=3075124 RepID=UPI003608135D
MIDRRIATVLVLTLLVVTTGCLGGVGLTDESGDDEDDDTDDELPDGDELLENALEADANVENVHGVQTVTMATDDEVVETKQEVWARGSDQMRTEVLESDNPDEIDVMVANGSTTWMYDEDANKASVMELAFGDEDLDAFGDALVDVGYGNVSASVEGTDTIADRDVYVLELTPDGDDAMFESTTMLIDQETHYPLKQETTTSIGGDLTITLEFEEIDFDPEVDDDLFTFEPPEDAEVYDANDFEPQQFDDVEGAESAVPFEIPEPDVPEEFTLETVTASENMYGSTATQQYADESGTFLSVSVGDAAGTASVLEQDGETVEIDDVEAVVREAPDLGTATVRWQDDGLTYTVNGDLETDELVAIAESIVE